MMATNSVDYIIRLIPDDSDLKKKLSSGELLNKSEIAKIKQLLTSVLESANRDAKNLSKSLQDGLDVDSTQLEKTLQLITGIFNELEKTGNPIKDWTKTGKGIYQAFENMQSSVSVLAQNVNTLQTRWTNLNSSFEAFKKSYQSFHPTQLSGVADEANKTASAVGKIGKALVTLGADKAAITNIKQFKSQLEEALKGAKVKLDIDYENLSDADLAKKLREKYGQSSKVSLQDILQFDFNSQIDNLDAINNALERVRHNDKEYLLERTKLIPVLQTIYAIESKIQKISGGKISLLPDLEDMGYGDYANINDIKEEIRDITKDVKDELQKSAKALNKLTGKLLDGLGTVDVKLSLSDADKQEFESQINTYIDQLNESKKIQPVNITLTPNEPEQETKRGRPKTKGQDEINAAQRRINQELETANKELEQKRVELAQLQTQQQEHPDNTRLVGQVKKAQAKVDALTKSINRYKFVIDNLEGNDALDISQNWNKLDASRAAIESEQNKLLENTKIWRQQMNQELKLSFAWSTYDTEETYRELIDEIRPIVAQYPIPIEPDVDYFMTALENALKDQELKVKVTTDGPLMVNGVTSGQPFSQQPIIPPIASVINEREKSVAPAVPTSVATDKITYEFTSKAGSAVDQIKAGADTIIDCIKDFTATENRFFQSARQQILVLQDVMNQNPNNQQVVEQVAREAKEILIDAIIKSFQNYFQESNRQYTRHSREIQRNTSIRDQALQAYNSESTKSARATAIKVKTQEIDELKSHSATYEYVELKDRINLLNRYAAIQQRINELEQRHDQNSQNKLVELRATEQSLLTQIGKTNKNELVELMQREKEALQGTREEYEKLIRLQQELNALYEEDKSDSNLKKVQDAQAQINKHEKLNRSIIRRRQAYASIGVPMEDVSANGTTIKGLMSLIDSGDKNAIYNFIIDTILSKADITHRMGPGVKAPNVSDDLRYFNTSTQKLATETISLVQQVLGLAQKTSAELDKQEASKDIFRGVQKLTAKHRALADLRDSSFLSSQQKGLFTDVRTQFATDWASINVKAPEQRNSRDQRYLNFQSALDEYEKASDEFRTIWASFDRETRQSIVTAADRVQVFNQRILDAYNTTDEATKKSINEALHITQQNGFADILSQSDHTRLVDIFKKIQDVGGSSVNTLLSTIRDRGRYDNVIRAQNAFEASIRGTKGDATHPYEDSIPQELTKQLGSYVFRVKIVDEKGNSKLIGYNADPRYNKRLGKITKGQRIPYNENLLPATKGANDFFSSISDDGKIEVEIFAGPNTQKVASSLESVLMRGGTQADYIETISTQSTKREGHQFAQNTSIAKQLIERAKTSSDLAQEDVLSAEQQLKLAQDKITRANQALTDLEAEKKRVLGDSTPADINARLNAAVQAAQSKVDAFKGSSVASAIISMPQIANNTFDQVSSEWDRIQDVVNNVNKIFANPLDSSLWSLVENLPDSVQNYAAINQEIDKLNKQAPKTREEEEQIRNRLRTLQEQKALSYQDMGVWVKKIEADAESQKQTLENKLKDNAPAVAKQYQDVLIDLTTQAEALQQQLQQHPNDTNIQSQLKAVVDIFKQIFSKYQFILDKYNVVTKGFLGNSLFKKAQLARYIYNNPNDTSARSAFGNIPSAFTTRDALIQEDSELTRKLGSATPEEKEALQRRRLEVAALYNETNAEILQWVIQQEKKYSISDVFKGFNSGKRLLNLENILATDFGNIGAQTTLAEAKNQLFNIQTERSEKRKALTQLATHEQDVKENVLPELERNKELVQLAQRRLEIEREIRTVKDESAKTALETELAQNRTRSMELGAVSRKAAVDMSAVQDAYYTIINEATLDIETSINKVKELTSRLNNQKNNLDILTKQYSSKTGKRYAIAQRAIDAAVRAEVQNYATTNPDEYSRIQKQVEVDNPRPYITSNREEEEYQRLLNGKINKAVEALVHSKIDEQKIINDAIATQKLAMTSTSAQIDAEKQYQAQMQAQIQQAMADGNITQAMLDERKGLTKALRDETVVTQESTQVARRQISQEEHIESVPTQDVHYQNYNSGQGSNNLYSFNTSGLATEDTLSAIRDLLSGGNIFGPERVTRESDDETLDPQLLAQVNEGVQGVSNRMDTIEGRLLELENIDTPEVKNENTNLELESKFSEAETRERARAGVAEEDAKEAAKMLQESTGRAIKTTVQRVGVELETLIERTDIKGNKTWSSEISNKYQKAMEAANKRISEQNLGNVFGVGTDAANALAEYETHYNNLLDLITKFKNASNEEKEGLQAEINALLPTFDQAEKKLISLIARKDKFIGDDEVVTTFSGKQLKSTRRNLEAEARKRYGGKLNPGSNVAFGGYKRGQGSGQLYVDVLKDGTIKQYVLEVDKATGQVKEYVAAENALANAFQNVNKAMKQNELVLADVAIGNTPEEQSAWMANASAPQLDAYKKAFEEMQNYTVQLWNSKDSPTQQQLDYLMQLSERVIVLGKNLQKTSGEFKNVLAQNPDSVFGIDVRDNDTVRSALERYAQTNAVASSSKYDFVGFDNDTLTYKLTDVEGKIRNVTIAWNELYKVAEVKSNKFSSTPDPLVNKIENLKQTIADAKANFYLLDTDDAKFNKALQEVSMLEQKVKDGTASFEELEAARRKAIGTGAEVKKLANKNAKLYVGTNEINSAKRQRDKILGTTGINLESEDQSSIFKKYIGEYDALIAKHQEYANQNQLNNPKIQEQLRQQAASVQKLGRQYIAAANEAETLQSNVDKSGDLGGVKQVSAEEVKNMEATMRAYASTVLGADLETVKFDSTTQTMTGVLRQNNRTVSDMVVKYNEATESLYLYQKQERESLSGFPALMRGIKEKMKSIMQYVASITSIYRIWGMLKQGVTYVREIDSALTELKKVTDETEATYDRFLNTAAKTADKVGSTIKEVVSSTADWARLGYSLEDAANLAESTSVLLNVSEFQSIDDATSALVSTMQAFGYAAKDSMHVVDVMNEIGKFIACR